MTTLSSLPPSTTNSPVLDAIVNTTYSFANGETASDRLADLYSDVKMLAVGIFVWDFLLTFNLALSLLRSRRWVLVNIMFFLVRVMSLVFATMTLYFTYGHPTNCNLFARATLAVSVICIMVSSCIFLIRTIAIWNYSRPIYILGGLWVVRAFCLSVMIAGIHGSNNPRTSKYACSMAMEEWTAEGFFANVVFDTAITVVTSYKLLQGRRKMGQFSSVVTKIIFRDGLIYYLVMAIANSVQLLVLLVTSATDLRVLFIPLVTILEIIMAQKTVLDCKKVSASPLNTVAGEIRIDGGLDGTTRRRETIYSKRSDNGQRGGPHSRLNSYCNAYPPPLFSTAVLGGNKKNASYQMSPLGSPRAAHATTVIPIFEDAAAERRPRYNDDDLFDALERCNAHEAQPAPFCPAPPSSPSNAPPLDPLEEFPNSNDAMSIISDGSQRPPHVHVEVWDQQALNETPGEHSTHLIPTQVASIYSERPRRNLFHIFGPRSPPKILNTNEIEVTTTIVQTTIEDTNDNNRKSKGDEYLDMN